MPNTAIPCNVDAEAAVLSAMLIDSDAVVAVLPLLKANDFYLERNGWIYQVMADLSEKRLPIDFVTVTDELERRGQLKQLGGSARIMELISATPSAAYAEHHASIVSRYATLRKLIVTAQQITQQAYADPDDLDDLLDWAQGALFGLSERRVKGTLQAARELMPAVVDRVEFVQKHAGSLLGVPTGYTTLNDKLGGLQKSDLIILAARPSMGKTALALNIAAGAALRHGSKVAFFSLEMSSAQLLLRMLSTETSIDHKRLKRCEAEGELLTQEEWGLLLEGANVISGAPLFIDDTPNAGVTEIRAKARRLQAEHGIDLIVVDYLQLMKGEGRQENRVQEVSLITRQMKALAREIDCPVLCLSQLSRAVEQRAEHRPQLSDLRDSGSIEQDADVVIFIDREEMRNPTTSRKGLADIIIAKHRNGETGDLEMYFDNAHTRFMDIQREV